MGRGRVVTLRAQDTDEQLALAVQAGDRDAADILVDRYTGLAYTLAWPYMTVRSDSDDMRQEALLAVVAAAHSYRPDGGATFKGLAVLAIRRRLFTVIKTDNTMGRRPAEWPLSINTPFDAGDGDDVTLEGAIADSFAVDPHDAAVRGERLRMLVTTVRDRLSAVEREALIRFLNGESQLEIEDALEVVLGRRSNNFWPDGRRRAKIAENAIDRARVKLRAALEEPRPLGVAA